MNFCLSFIKSVLSDYDIRLPISLNLGWNWSHKISIRKVNFIKNLGIFKILTWSFYEWAAGLPFMVPFMVSDHPGVESLKCVFDQVDSSEPLMLVLRFLPGSITVTEDHISLLPASGLLMPVWWPMHQHCGQHVVAGRSTHIQISNSMTCCKHLKSKEPYPAPTVAPLYPTLGSRENILYWYSDSHAESSNTFQISSDQPSQSFVSTVIRLSDTWCILNKRTNISCI